LPQLLSSQVVLEVWDLFVFALGWLIVDLVVVLLILLFFQDYSETKVQKVSGSPETSCNVSVFGTKT